MDVKLRAFLTFLLYGDEQPASCSGQFTLKERAPDNYWTAGSTELVWALGSEKYLCACWKLKPFLQSSSLQHESLYHAIKMMKVTKTIKNIYSHCNILLKIIRYLWKEKNY
jgi:hypothetical protein